VILDWTNIIAATIGTYSNSIISIVTWVDSNHIKSTDRGVATRDIKVADTWANINTSSNYYIGVNIGITRTTTNFEYNRN
jgi:hypothetical protein